jgi:hypothetical protein
LLAQLGIDFVMVGCANAGIANALDSALHANAAFGSCHKVVDAIDYEWKQRGHAECANADAKPAASTAMHEIAYQKACGCSKKGRCRECTVFDPNGF